MGSPKLDRDTILATYKSDKYKGRLVVEDAQLRSEESATGHEINVWYIKCRCPHCGNAKWMKKPTGVLPASCGCKKGNHPHLDHSLEELNSEYLGKRYGTVTVRKIVEDSVPTNRYTVTGRQKTRPKWYLYLCCDCGLSNFVELSQFQRGVGIKCNHCRLMELLKD